jgi:hypothetical protein
VTKLIEILSNVTDVAEMRRLLDFLAGRATGCAEASAMPPSTPAQKRVRAKAIEFGWVEFSHGFWRIREAGRKSLAELWGSRRHG